MDDAGTPYADAAHVYLKRGWAPLPLPARRKSPPPKGWTGRGAPYPSAADIQAWIDGGSVDGHTIGNIALRMPDDVIGIDVDAHSGKGGGETLAELETKLGPLPETLRSTSRLDDPISGIRFYRVPPGLWWRDPGTGIETIQAGYRFAVVAPSIHDEGRPYAWLNGTAEPCTGPTVADLVDLPDAWVTELSDGDAGSRNTGHWGKLDPEQLHPADRLALAALIDLGGHDPFQADGYIAITRPGKKTGTSASIGHIGPGIVKVFTSHWPPLEARVYDADQLGALGNGGDPDLDNEEGEQQEEGQGDRGDPEADLANARLLAAEHKDTLRYVVAWKKWLVWDGTRWKPDETGEAVRCAKAVADHLPKRSKRGPSRSQTRAGLEAMLALAGTEPGIAVSPSMLDADPYLINCTNGTLDLRTLELRAHDRDDLVTKVTGAAYDPEAQAPTFTAFLDRVQPDDVMRSFLARLFGHALLGKVVEHVLPVLYGIGANGKTTLLEAVATALGDYSDTVEPGLLLDRGEVHPTGVADLFGLRLAITHETDEGRRLAEGTVKRLTGGDRVKARRMREDFWSFDPSHSIIMATNHKPAVRGTDEGIWRRLRLVPFTVVVPAEERDGKLPERLALERDGIFAWIVAGHRQWKDRGLADPQAVTDATASFRNESDLLALFIAERCLTSPHAYVKSSELFAAWVEWCKRENVDAGTQTAFSLKLTEKGFDKDRTKTGMVWRGIGLYTDETAEG